MPKFEYIAKSPLGEERSSALHAESAEAAADVLHRDGLVVLSIREVSESVRSRLSLKSSIFAPRVPSSIVVFFTKQLSSMLGAGLPLIRALYGLAREERNNTFHKVLLQVAADIEGGDSLSAALSRHPSVFSDLYVNMIRSGEQSGTLGTIMADLERYLHRTETIKRKVKSAMTYPVFVVSFAIVAFVVLMVKIVPTMAEIYQRLNADLPTITQVVISASDLVTANLWVLALVAAGLVAAYQLMNRSVRGKLVLDTFKLRTPLLGPILRKVVVAKFLRTLGILVSSGLPILESLELAGLGSGNQVVAAAAGRIAAGVSKGGNLAAGFRAADVFPEIVVQMVSTGEETGRLDEMLSIVSDHYDEQVETSIESLASLIEPLMIVFVGGLIAIILVAMFLPVFHLGGAIRRGMS